MCERTADPTSLDDAALNRAILECARNEAAIAGRRLAAIAELIDRRTSGEVAEAREVWNCDAWDSGAAEVAAGLAIGHRAANTLMRQALALRDRLPRVGELLARGSISLRLANTLTWRTVLIVDEDVLARADAELSAAASAYGPMSERKLQDAIDSVVQRHDPDAVRRFRQSTKGGSSTSPAAANDGSTSSRRSTVAD